MKNLLTKVIGADLEGFGLPHNKANLPSLLVLQKLNGAGTSLLPLVSVFVETVELRFTKRKTKITDTENQFINQKSKTLDFHRSPKKNHKSESTGK